MAGIELGLKIGKRAEIESVQSGYSDESDLKLFSSK